MDNRIIDFHTHILPGVDHGSDCLSNSIEQVKLLLTSGVNTIVSTSHYYPHKDELNLFLEIRQKAFRDLNKALSEENIEADIRLGAEVLLCPGLDKLEGLEKLCISGTKNILIELPFSNFRSEYLETIENIIDLGFDVILAHVDRYPPEIIDTLSYLNLKFQINAESLCTFIKNRKLYEWIEKGFVVALGSDLHNLDKKGLNSFIKCSATN